MNSKIVNIFCTEEIKNPLPRQKALVSSWIKKRITEADYTFTSLSIIFCSDEYLLQMNIQHLEHDYYTDVITFDNSEPNSKTIDGEIYISLDRVKENATQFTEPFKKEVLRIIAHGVLHLLGFGDKTPTEKSEMTKAENDFLLSAEHLY